MGYLPRVLGVTLRDKVRSCEIRKTLNVEPLLPESRGPSYVGQPYVQIAPGRNIEESPAGYSHGKAAHKVFKGPGGVTTSPTLLGTVLVWSQQNYLRLLFIVRYFESS